ncbi:MAG: ATP-binding cassette domain-containing protein [Clostridia bacterium]|nr:ATP-binding cassette domain-containing protein [Clostridia bacterium]
MIKLENLYKEFKTRSHTVTALNDVSLDIKKGEIYGIIGLSGAGKSTLIRTVNRLEEPTSGTVTINGVELTGLTQKALRKERQKIGMIFQQFNLLSSRTVEGNIGFPLELSAFPKNQRRARISELLSQVGLDDKRNAYPSQLSGGQKQRVAIARALANTPDVLLCDEATSALDPKTTKSILQLLKQINRDNGLTIILITHEMDVIKEICDRVAVIENGVITSEGSVKDVFHSMEVFA